MRDQLICVLAVAIGMWLWMAVGDNHFLFRLVVSSGGAGLFLLAVCVVLSFQEHRRLHR